MKKLSEDFSNKVLLNVLGGFIGFCFAVALFGIQSCNMKNKESHKYANLRVEYLQDVIIEAESSKYFLDKSIEAMNKEKLLEWDITGFFTENLNAFRTQRHLYSVQDDNVRRIINGYYTTTFSYDYSRKLNLHLDFTIDKKKIDKLYNDLLIFICLMKYAARNKSDFNFTFLDFYNWVLKQECDCDLQTIINTEKAK